MKNADYHNETEVPVYTGDLENKVYVRFLGTSTLFFGVGNKGFMIDGFVTRPGIFSTILTGMTSKKSDVLTQLKKADLDFNSIEALFVSHSHYDHALDASEYETQVFGSNVTKASNESPWYNFKLLEYSKTPIPVGDFEIWAIPGKHVNKPLGTKNLEAIFHKIASQGDKYRQHGPVYNFYIKYQNLKVLVVSSANYPDIYPEFVKPDIVFLGIGMLSNWLDKRPPHPTPSDSRTYAEIFWEKNVESLGARMVIPVHWDSFNYELGSQLRLPYTAVDDVSETLEFLKSKAESHSSTGQQIEILMPPALKPFLLAPLVMKKN